MAGRKEKPEDIVSKLRQVEVLQGQGATIAEAVRQLGGEVFKPPLMGWMAEKCLILRVAENELTMCGGSLAYQNAGPAARLGSTDPRSARCRKAVPTKSV